MHWDYLAFLATWILKNVLFNKFLIKEEIQNKISTWKKKIMKLLSIRNYGMQSK